MKVPDGGDVDCVLARKDTWTSDGQDDMSKKGGSLDCEYRRRLRERFVRSNRLSFMVAPPSGGMKAFMKSRMGGMDIHPAHF